MAEKETALGIMQQNEEKRLISYKWGLGDTCNPYECPKVCPRITRPYLIFVMIELRFNQCIFNTCWAPAGHRSSFLFADPTYVQYKYLYKKQGEKKTQADFSNSKYVVVAGIGI